MKSTAVTTTVLSERTVAVSSSSVRSESNNATTRSVRLEATYSNSSSTQYSSGQQRQQRPLTPLLLRPAVAFAADSDNDEAWNDDGRLLGRRPLRLRPLSAAASASPASPSPFDSPLGGGGDGCGGEEAALEWRRFIAGLEERHATRRRLLCDGGGRQPTVEAAAVEATDGRPIDLTDFRLALLEVSAIDCQVARNLQQVSVGLAQLRRAAAAQLRRQQQQRQQRRLLGLSGSQFSEDTDDEASSGDDADAAGDTVAGNKEAATSEDSTSSSSSVERQHQPSTAAAEEACGVRIDVQRPTDDDGVE